MSEHLNLGPTVKVLSVFLQIDKGLAFELVPLLGVGEVLWFLDVGLLLWLGDMLAVSIMMKTIKIKTLLEVLLRDASG